MNNENSEPVKSVSAGSIVLWILGVLVILGGISQGSIIAVIGGAILLPITNTLSKKYLKFNFSGMARFIIAVILIIIGTVVSTSWDSAREATSTQSGTSGETAAQEETYTEIFSLSGKGNQDSQSFNVTGKKVRLTATTTSNSSVGTFSGVSLKKENGGYTGPGLSISTDGSEAGTGQTTYRNLAPGTYYVQVISGVNWKVSVEQAN